MGNITSLQLAPHQRDLVELLERVRSPARVLLVAPPGLGRSTAIAAGIAKTISGHAGSRILVVSPSTLCDKWRVRMTQLVDVEPVLVDAPTYRDLQLEAGDDENPWHVASLFVTSIDFLKRNDRAAEAALVGWNLIVLSDVDSYGADKEGTHVARTLWSHPNVECAIAVVTSKRETDWLNQSLTMAPRVVDWKAVALPKQRRVSITQFQLNDAERELDRELRRLAQIDATDTLVQQFTWKTLLEQWESSVYALEQALSRALNPPLDSRELTGANDDQNPSDTSTISPVVARSLLNLADDIATDSKWETCRELLSRGEFSREGQPVIITKFQQTAEYLAARLDQERIEHTLLTGRLSRQERDQLSASTETNQIMILTDVVRDALLSIQAPKWIHYDVPASMEGLTKRFLFTQAARRHASPTTHHFFVAQGQESERRLSSFLAEAELD